MENILINPVNYQTEYLQYLNECFPGWGNAAKYDWVFTRKVTDHSADIIIIKDEDNEVIAGSGVSYRKLAVPGKQMIDISIMTGSWTLPKARGKGCFSKIILLSLELAQEKNVSFLTAFVTEANASSRRLEDAGSLLIPTYHFFSPVESFADTSGPIEIEITDALINELYNRFIKNAGGFLQFTYSFTGFSEQYIYRTKRSTILRYGNEYAIIEETHNVIMVLLLLYDNTDAFESLIKSLSDWAMKNKSKKILLFTTRAEISVICMKLNFDLVPGYFTILGDSNVIDLQKHLNEFNINAGDKM